MIWKKPEEVPVDSVIPEVNEKFKIIRDVN
jgi:hypothetical protein